MDLRAFYLKYRPQKISELDLEEISQGLLKIVQSGKIPHALLFSGPKGIGKTSAARVLAKAVNCLEPKDGEPCNHCQNCEEITSGIALDILEIDAASNRGIDDIRNLREKIKLSPVKAKYKVYIIDEAHMLTTEAFNALLKTLEEPPSHAIFILCTTAPEKLPKTIISRCLSFNFRKAKVEEIIKALKRAAKGEKLEAEKGVLEAIANGVDGSFRDAHKILEQLSFAGRKISLEEAQKLLSQTEELSPGKLLAFLASQDTKAALQEIDRVVQRGGDLSVYSQEILGQLRTALLAQLGVVQDNPPANFSKDQLKNLIRLFSQAALEIKTSPILQLPLELAVVEWCEEKGQSAKCPPAGRVADTAGRVDEVPIPQSKVSKKLEEILARWSELLAGVRPMNHSVEALLKAARPVKIDGETLTLEVFYKFHKERLETEKCRSVVEEVAQQVLGAPIKLKCILGEKRTKEEPKSDIIDVASEIFNGKLVS